MAAITLKESGNVPGSAIVALPDGTELPKWIIDLIFDEIRRRIAETDRITIRTSSVPGRSAGGDAPEIPAGLSRMTS